MQLIKKKKLQISLFSITTFINCQTERPNLQIYMFCLFLLKNDLNTTNCNFIVLLTTDQQSTLQSNIGIQISFILSTYGI